MFGMFKKNPGGEIKFYGLSDWWLSTFTEDERKEITATFQPLGYPKNGLVEGDIYFADGSPTQLLSALAGWFKKELKRTLAYRMLEKAEELSSKAAVIDRHFLYQAKIQIYYRFRDVDDFALSKAIEACEQQIAMSGAAATAFKKEYPDAELPAHVGYQQLAIIREKQGNMNEAIRICEKAIEQGWCGNWEERIKRYRKKL
jgi:tetratricopeptide (TPR) repeat protein